MAALIGHLLAHSRARRLSQLRRENSAHTLAVLGERSPSLQFQELGTALPHTGSDMASFQLRPYESAPQELFSRIFSAERSSAEREHSPSFSERTFEYATGPSRVSRSPESLSEWASPEQIESIRRERVDSMMSKMESLTTARGSMEGTTATSANPLSQVPSITLEPPCSQEAERGSASAWRRAHAGAAAGLASARPSPLTLMEQQGALSLPSSAE
eukprot:CAMPEP_0177578772 /NCGR_PEP_ID=MMETSP0419_2-20121207/544_1 /TAXON_ID=582737 /ORGANISM="Tetraselmis sp., Strain GSL018" /LENGTH=215 /DNA_ID=CAMNT_0019067273 /DNA_START=661 /DNA_END=1305 /DNA_ORIENTATION=-